VLCAFGVFNLILVAVLGKDGRGAARGGRSSRVLLHVHCPSTHAWPGWQTALQEPQCRELLFVSTHCPEQYVESLLHAHVPAAQVEPPVHALPQPPQCSLLELVSTQT
jgi:hypothetical protein